MLHAGLDLSRRKVDVCLLSAGGDMVEEFASPPDGDGLGGLARRVGRHGLAVRGVIESMTGARFVHDTLEFAGWEVADRATLDRVAQQLEDGGVNVTAGTRDEADGRRVIDLIKCADPNGIPTDYITQFEPQYVEPIINGAYPGLPLFRSKTNLVTNGWDMVYVPYCTGDVHVGNRVVTYTDPTGVNPPIVFRHNGYNNSVGIRLGVGRLGDRQ
jgi:hypothetical protein